MAKGILIIDDDPVMVRWLSKRLQVAGYVVYEAFDGASGLETARQKSPDLIILDVMMPELNGFSVCGFLRSDHALYQVPIIMMTARQEEYDQKFDEPFGPDAFLIKPVDIEEVMEKVAQLI